MADKARLKSNPSIEAYAPVDLSTLPTQRKNAKTPKLSTSRSLKRLIAFGG
jgi:hypothetical protein